MRKTSKVGSKLKTRAKQIKVIEVALIMKAILKVAKTVNKRRPWDDDQPHGYLESDADYLANNRFAAVKLLDLALILSTRVES